MPCYSTRHTLPHFGAGPSRPRSIRSAPRHTMARFPIAPTSEILYHTRRHGQKRSGCAPLSLKKGSKEMATKKVAKKAPAKKAPAKKAVKKVAAKKPAAKKCCCKKAAAKKAPAKKAAKKPAKKAAKK